MKDIITSFLADVKLKIKKGPQTQGINSGRAGRDYDDLYFHQGVRLLEHSTGAKRDLEQNVSVDATHAKDLVPAREHRYHLGSKPVFIDRLKNFNGMRFSLFYCCALIAAFACSTNKEQENIRQKPNFIIIQMDDLGWDDLSLHGNKFLQTPGIDQLGNNSVQFSNFYVNAVCAPTRASMLTGRHFLKTGVSHVHGGKDFLNLDEQTIADILNDNGYVTGMWGKWHSGQTDGYFPWQRGFQEAYKAKLYKHRNPEGLFNGSPVSFPGKWSSQVITDYALDFIDRNQGNNFLAYLSFLTCHGPLDAPDSLVDKYEQMGLSKNLSTLYGMIDLADQNIQRLLIELDKKGLSENTVVFFLSDNWPAIEIGTLTDLDREIRYVNNYKGHKGNLWENGVKSAFFVRWTSQLKANKVHTLADVTDIFPTILDMAGIDLNTSKNPLDGYSLNSVLKNGQPSEGKLTYDYASPGWAPNDQPWTPQGIKNEYQPYGVEIKDTLIYSNQILSVRNDSLKLMLNVAQYLNTPAHINSRVLVNIRQDPKEHKNIITEYEAEAGKLESALKNWFQEVKKTDHSFGSPVFNVSDDRSEILAKGAYKMSSNLKKSFNWIEGFGSKHDSISFHVNVKHAGKYIFSFIMGEKEISIRELEMQSGRQDIELSGFEALGHNDKLDKILVEKVKGG